MDNTNSGDFIAASASSLQCDNEVDDSFIKNLKSIIYTLNAKPDTEIKVFDKIKTITLSDINDLREKVNSKLATHNCLSNMATINISFSDYTVKSFTNWSEFDLCQWNTGATIKSINIEWDFYLIIPRYQRPQRHTLKVRMGSDLSPTEYITILLNTDEEIESKVATSNVICKIDFINSSFANDILNLVSNWYDSLRDNPFSKFSSFALGRGRFVSDFINKIITLAAIFIVYLSYTKIFSTEYGVIILSDFLHLPCNIVLFYTAIAISFIYIFNYIGFIFGRTIERKLNKLKDSRKIFSITKGDKNYHYNLNKKNRGLLIDIIIELTSSFIVFLILTLYSIITTLFK